MLYIQKKERQVLNSSLLKFGVYLLFGKVPKGTIVAKATLPKEIL